MYTITIESSFKASHQLTYAGGKKEQVHQHDWQLRVAAQIDAREREAVLVPFDQNTPDQREPVGVKAA